MTESDVKKLTALMGTPLKEIEEEFVSLAEMQRKIMPEPHLVRTFGDYDIYGGTLPVASVGGDFYDFIDFRNFAIADRMGFVIADASGHGLSAAMLVRDFNTALYTGIGFESHYARDTTPLLFERINARMFNSSLPNQFITAFYGELRPDGSLHYINAGHHSPLVFQGEEVTQLSTGGLMLGAFLNPPGGYQTGHVTLQPNDSLVAFTDGIIESANPEGEEYSLDRLRQELCNHRQASVRDIFSQTMQSVESHMGNARQADDQTLIVIRRREGD